MNAIYEMQLGKLKTCAFPLKDRAGMENKVLTALQVAKQTIDGWTRDSEGRVTVHPDVVSKAVNAAIAELEGQ